MFRVFSRLRKFNAENFLGSAVALGILRELGPVLSAFMVTGRTGSAMAAELASMKVSEQIDALYSMAVNPIQYLVTPRIIAGLISMSFYVIVGKWSDRVGRKKPIIIGAIATLALLFPIFWILRVSGMVFSRDRGQTVVESE